jgi:ribosome-associated heat shock protein Hsp15
VRVNGARIAKPSAPVGPGDVLTFAQGRRIRVIRVAAIGRRRGPATEARTLYEDLAPPESLPPASDRVGPRPTKKNRRALDDLRDGES